MAFGSSSKIFAYTITQALNNAIALAAGSDGFKCALYNNGGTPDNTVTTAALSSYNGAGSAWVAANELTSTNYTAGGAALTSVTSSQSTNVWTFGAANTSWTSVTFTGADSGYGCLIYDTTLGTQGLAFLSFGGIQSVTAGTFTVAYTGGAIATITLT